MNNYRYKIHYKILVKDRIGSIPYVLESKGILCGIKNARKITTKKEDVTCDLCLFIMKEKRRKRRKHRKHMETFNGFLTKGE